MQEDDRYRSHVVYDGNKSASWAQDHKDDPEEYKGNDCTNFLSKALHAGNLPNTNAWNSSQSSWITTPDLYKYLTKEVGFNTTEIQTDIDYYPSGTSDRGLLSEEIGLQDFLKQGTVEKGDLVFFQDGSLSDTWTHAAIVVDFATEQDSEGITYKVPLIVEHSGPSGFSLPRRVDSSTNTNIWALAFVSPPR